MLCTPLESASWAPGLQPWAPLAFQSSFPVAALSAISVVSKAPGAGEYTEKGH